MLKSMTLKDQKTMANPNTYETHDDTCTEAEKILNSVSWAS